MVQGGEEAHGVSATAHSRIMRIVMAATRASLVMVCCIMIYYRAKWAFRIAMEVSVRFAHGSRNSARAGERHLIYRTHACRSASGRDAAANLGRARPATPASGPSHTYV